MHQLTITGFGEDLSACVTILARQEGISLNQAAMKLLRKGAGLADKGEDTGVVSSSLDHLIGSWTQVEAEELDSALQALETIDEQSWQ